MVAKIAKIKQQQWNSLDLKLRILLEFWLALCVDKHNFNHLEVLARLLLIFGFIVLQDAETNRHRNATYTDFHAGSVSPGSLPCPHHHRTCHHNRLYQSHHLQENHCFRTYVTINILVLQLNQDPFTEIVSHQNKVKIWGQSFTTAGLLYCSSSADVSARGSVGARPDHQNPLLFGWIGRCFLCFFLCFQLVCLSSLDLSASFLRLWILN